MAQLNLGLEIVDFDLERVGFSISVLDPTKNRQSSDAYLRMTLGELAHFVSALRAARDEIELTAVEAFEAGKPPRPKGRLR
jgi:hypothetical protein